jgi:hypothetical protein
LEARLLMQHWLAAWVTGPVGCQWSCVYAKNYRTLGIATRIANKLLYIKSDIIAARMDTWKSTASEFGELAKYLLCPLFRRCVLRCGACFGQVERNVDQPYKLMLWTNTLSYIT